MVIKVRIVVDFNPGYYQEGYFPTLIKRICDGYYANWEGKFFSKDEKRWFKDLGNEEYAKDFILEHGWELVDNL